MYIHIQKIRFASTRNAGDLFLDPKLRFSCLPKQSRKPCVPKSMSIDGNLALIRALYVSGGLIRVIWARPKTTNARPNFSGVLFPPMHFLVPTSFAPTFPESHVLVPPDFSNGPVFLSSMILYMILIKNNYTILMGLNMFLIGLIGFRWVPILFGCIFS